MLHFSSPAKMLNEAEILQKIREISHPLQSKIDLDPLLNLIGDVRVVMLGEASHGNHEYYVWRSEITKRLIEEKGFSFIAVEGDWPDCYRLNRYIKGYEGKHTDVLKVLHRFNRWPTWMWANWEIASLANWLNNYNQKLPANKKIGFYGLDVYSLWESMDSIIEYLKQTDPAALKYAEEAFECFEPYKMGEGTSYANACQIVPEICKDEVVRLLQEVRKKMPTYNSDYENVLSTEQNAVIAVNAEKYYSAMLYGGPHSWNIRDRHMNDTLLRLLKFHGEKSKVIVWAHNTHIGDARATDMTGNGMFNVGELARLQFQEKGVVLVGFGSYSGSVMAGRKWGAKMEEMDMPDARHGSWEYLLHQSDSKNKLLLMEDLRDDIFMENHFGHRAIGVVYNPEFEHFGNYVPSILPLRYDAFIYLDKSKALHPLHLQTDGLQIPETYPFGV